MVPGHCPLACPTRNCFTQWCQEGRYPARVARRLTPWLLAAVWTVPAALMTAQAYLFDYPDQRGAWLARSLLHDALPWVIWMLVTPLVMRETARPDALRRSRLARHLGLALATSVAFGAAHGALAHAAGLWRDAPTLWAATRMGIIDWLPIQPLVYAGLVATGIALESARRRRAAELGRARLEAELAQAQLAALRAQLQPHFLFNTLNAAVTLARAGDSAGTAHVLLLLSDLLRHLLRADAPQEVPLGEELRLLETYLEIQRVRFGERLQISWEVDKGVLGALVPQLVLQPLVENALEHGIARRARAGRLDIAAERVGDELRLTVADDGGGLAPGFSLAAADGLGLRNTLARLRRLYGEAGEVRLTSEPAGPGDREQRDLHDGRDGWAARTVAVVVLPFHGEAHGVTPRDTMSRSGGDRSGGEVGHA